MRDNEMLHKIKLYQTKYHTINNENEVLSHMLNSFDAAYHSLCEEVLEIGNTPNDGAIRVDFRNLVMNFALTYLKGFPLLTTKKVSFY